MLIVDVVCSEAGEEASRPGGGDSFVVECGADGCVVRVDAARRDDSVRCTVRPAAGGHHLRLTATRALPA